MINNFLIIGDSYSTYKGYIPEGYSFYYCEEGVRPELPGSKMLVEDTWWGRLIKNTDANLILNDSWGGSTIGYTGYDGDCSSSSSFIYRYNKLFEEGFFTENKIDTIFVFGGTNDSWANAPLGQMQYSDWEKEDLFNVLPAICYLMYRLKNDNPDTKIIFIGNSGLKTEIIDCMRDAAKQIGVEFIELDEVEKENVHPTIRGMEQIYDQIMQKLNG